jgi:hypothetical protein
MKWLNCVLFLPFTSSSWWVHVGVISLVVLIGANWKRRQICGVVVFRLGRSAFSWRKDPSWQRKANWVVWRSKSKYMTTSTSFFSLFLFTVVLEASKWRPLILSGFYIRGYFVK